MLDDETLALIQGHLRHIVRLLEQHDNEAHGGQVCWPERINLVAFLLADLGLTPHMALVRRRVRTYLRKWGEE